MPIEIDTGSSKASTACSSSLVNEVSCLALTADTIEAQEEDLTARIFLLPLPPQLAS